MVEIPQSDKPIIIQCDYSSGTGYGTLTRNLLGTMIWNNIDLRILPEPELFPNVLSKYEKEFFEEHILKPEERHFLAGDDYIYFRLYPPRENVKRKFNITLTMVEGYTVYPHHIDIINEGYDLILVPSYFVKDVLSQYIDPEKLYVIPLGVNRDFNTDIKRFKDANFKQFNEDKKLVETHAQPSHYFKFGSFAKFNHKKGVDLVIESFLEEFKSDEEAQLVLFYSPENPFEPHRMEDRMRDIIYQYDNPNIKNIFVCDETFSSSDQNTPYGWMNCFVFPSRGEGFGLTPMEAAACGLPLICSNNTALGDFINHSNSFVVDTDRIDKIGEIGEQYNVETYTGNYPNWTKDMFHHQTRHCYFPILEYPRVKQQIKEHMRYVFNDPKSSTVLEKKNNMLELIETKYRWNDSAVRIVELFKDFIRK